MANPDDSVLLTTNVEVKAPNKLFIPAASRLIWAHAVHKLLYGSTFYVSTLRELRHLGGRDVDRHLLETLATLHCDSYINMPEAVRSAVRKGCLDLLGIPVEALGDIELGSMAPNHELVGRLVTFLETQ